MIYVNGKEVSLTNAMLNLNQKKNGPKDPNYPWFNVDRKTPYLFKLSERMKRPGYKNIKGGERGRQTRPRSIMLDPFYTLSEQGEDKQVRYVKQVQKRHVGEKIIHNLLPEIISIDKSSMIQTNNKDLWYFLVNHPRMAAGKNKDNRQAFFYLENLEKDAEKYVGSVLDRRKAEDIIFEADGVDLTNLASFHGLPNASNKTAEEQQQYLLRMNPSDIIKSKGDSSFEVISIIQRSLDAQYIHYNPKAGQFRLKAEDNTLGAVLCTVRPQEKKDSKRAFAKFLIHNDRDKTLDVLKGLLGEEEE